MSRHQPLDFEAHLRADMALPRRRVWGAFAILALIGVFTFGGVVGAWAGIIWWRSDPLNEEALAQTADVLVTGLQEQDWPAAMAVCAEGEKGRQLLAAEERRVGLPTETADAAAAEEARETRQQILASVRAELEGLGLDWASVRPVGFGGLRAKLNQEQQLADSVDVLFGAVFVEAKNGLYAIELTLWECGDAYVVVDVWRGFKVPVGLDRLSKYSRDYAQYLREAMPDDPDEIQTEHEKHVFVPFIDYPG